MDNKWISVNDQLPDHYPPNERLSVDVLVYGDIEYGNKAISMAFYNFVKQDWRRCGNEETVYGVTHWMPLPLPPNQD